MYCEYVNNNCFYLKFTTKTIHKIKEWDQILINSFLYDMFQVFIWIYHYDIVDDVTLVLIEYVKMKYDKCIFVSNLNIKNFLKEEDISDIDKIVSSLKYHHDVGRSIITSYYIGKKI